jgi:ABC-2 type transport system permease protein
MSALLAVYLRELRAYFLTPLAYVFIAIFLLALGAFAFEIGGFFAARRADLSAVFAFHPWLYLVLTPAIAMRLWADEIREGSIELMLSLPAPVWALVAGKFLAAWTVVAVALGFTLPFWITVGWLGSPDHAAIALTYGMSLLMAGAYLSIACALSAAAGNQVVAFVLSVAVGVVFTAAGTPLVLGSANAVFGPRLADAIGNMSLLGHFETAQRGVLEARAMVFYVSFIALWLCLNTLWVDARRRR